MDNRLLQECMQPLAVAISSHRGWSMGEKSLNAWLSILQFPDSTTATMLSPATSPRFHVQAVRMDTHSCDAMAFYIAAPAWPIWSRHLPDVVLMQ
ncbi:hypothetical protein N7467_010913 [Penicillium canescens]|nr:hypothetical protein N7467_010913 [Penicillium canescens]